MTTLLRRYLPDSLSKQLSITLLASVTLLFFVNIGAVSFIQARFLGLLEKERASNIVSIYVLLTGMETAQRDAALARLIALQSSTRHSLNFHLTESAPTWANSQLPPAEQAIATLETTLSENKVDSLPNVQARIFLKGDPFNIDVWARQVSGSAPVCDNPLLQVGVQLDAGHWLNITQPLYQSSMWLIWIQRMVFIFEFVAFAVMVLFIFRRLLKPFQQLTQSADCIGKQPEFASPVPESGCREIVEAAQAFNRMQARIRENLNERDRMLAAMAHDLRTPLTRLHLLSEEAEPEELREKFSEGIKEVRSIVEQSLELSSSLRTSEKPGPLGICAFMQSRVDDFADAGNNVTMKSVQDDMRLAVMARPLCLKRCVDNLLHNAVVYAGNATVNIHATETSVVIDICDDGPGIPDDYLEKVFEPYLRLEDSRNRQSGGTGLGLSIARNMIILNDGILTLENRPEGGLQARIVLARLNKK